MQQIIISSFIDNISKVNDMECLEERMNLTKDEASGKV